ncbi:MAG: nucleoside hydrolase [Ilumatobacter sp.]|uniref:nucleoside hydrolase n=1 Tax=Ilumatobacter sp. TaxID=1967498 RepID=UPI0026330000|nr:nucleoside hydrolase [Ilumatobacter sp.]MDJ0768795.1 nucleoside hydrolase [Ilumatobacter sp.]
MAPTVPEPASERAGARPRIVLDCDPGHDDVIAILVAALHTDLAGITTVAGNAPLDRTTYNACVMRDALALDVPVHSGAARPLTAPPRFAGFVHGESGLDGADLPAPERGADSTDAVAFIVDTCRASEGTWLVPTGPLTNIALALRTAPDLAGRIAGVSLMGGGTFGNRSPMAEFNIWADPEAAAVVFGSGVPLTMAGLDVTHQLVVTLERADEVAALDSPFTTMIAGLFRFFAGNYIARHDAATGAALHDPLAVMALTHPALLDGTDRHVTIETRGEHTTGMTVIDRRDISDREPPNCHVLEHVDDAGAWQVVVDALRWAGERAAAVAAGAGSPPGVQP